MRSVKSTISCGHQARKRCPRQSHKNRTKIEQGRPKRRASAVCSKENHGEASTADSSVCKKTGITKRCATTRPRISRIPVQSACTQHVAPAAKPAGWDDILRPKVEATTDTARAASCALDLFDNTPPSPGAVSDVTESSASVGCHSLSDGAPDSERHGVTNSAGSSTPHTTLSSRQAHTSAAVSPKDPSRQDRPTELRLAVGEEPTAEGATTLFSEYSFDFEEDVPVGGHMPCHPGSESLEDSRITLSELDLGGTIGLRPTNRIDGGDMSLSVRGEQW